MGIQIQRITPAIGAVIQGVKLNEDITQEQENAIHEALLEHQILFFRDQEISPEQQYRFAKRFGDLHIHPVFPKFDHVPEILILDSHRNDLADNAIWHTDVTFLQAPAKGCVLSAQQVPEFGGDTLWASGYAAWEGLSPRLQVLLDGLTAKHDFTRSFPVERYGNTAEAFEQWENARLANPPVSHPVIRTHPITGKKALFVNDGFTVKINELPDAESDALLRFLFIHATKPEYSLRWHWQKGDIAFWDNRSTQHYASDDYGDFQRIMHRATIIGDKPY